jgi:hypothetical protein
MPHVATPLAPLAPPAHRLHTASTARQHRSPAPLGTAARHHRSAPLGTTRHRSAPRAQQSKPLARASRWSVRQVIIFYSMLPSGEMDDFSLHGGCDVLDEQATKWSANFWLWNKPYHFIDAARQRGTQDLMDSWL